MFRDGRRELSGEALRRGLAAALAVVEALAGASRASQASRERRGEATVGALLRAGEIEHALADAGADASEAAAITDAAAEALLGGAPPPAATAARLSLPATLRAGRPEGFAYYALHPLSFARLAEALPIPGQARAAVIGIRSIGATLSAVVAAALRRRGARASRITVRPEGHPYDRRLALTGPALSWARGEIEAGAEILVVDEGPGLSGSSFLAVGDALAAAGAAPERVTFLCSREPDPEALLAPDGARRARAARWRAVDPGPILPAGAGEPLGGGRWRELLLPDRSRWPACWPAFERIKHLDADGGRLLKFEGLGPYGAEVRERAAAVAEAGFGPAPADAGEGFLAYPLLPGRLLRAEDATWMVLDRIAAYCAFRVAAFPAGEAEPLETAVQANAAAVLGIELDRAPALPVARPVIADGRMMPHEWIAAPGAAPLKVDAAAHGDDHFFPGPTDAAWDLAGAVVELGLGPAAERFLLERYARASGDHAERRLGPWLVAYALHRAALTGLAAASVGGGEEAERLATASEGYRQALAKLAARWPEAAEIARAAARDEPAARKAG